jgi:hypothetical protein
MSKYNLTEPQKELLRTIIKSDDAGHLPEEGVLLVMRGDDQYILTGGILRHFRAFSTPQQNPAPEQSHWRQ